MELVVKHFSELSLEELVDIYKLRVSVFVVEQNCAYQEIDDADKVAYHLYLKDDCGIQAYARVLPKGTTFDEVSLGRVIAKKRRCGLGSRILNEAIETAKWRIDLWIDLRISGRKNSQDSGRDICSKIYISYTIYA